MSIEMHQRVKTLLAEVAALKDRVAKIEEARTLRLPQKPAKKDD